MRFFSVIKLESKSRSVVTSGLMVGLESSPTASLLCEPDAVDEGSDPSNIGGISSTF